MQRLAIQLTALTNGNWRSARRSARFTHVLTELAFRKYQMRAFGNDYTKEINLLRQEAAAIKADLIVMTSHRPAMRTYFLGSNAGHVVRYAKCSVLVVRH